MYEVCKSDVCTVCLFSASEVQRSAESDVLAEARHGRSGHGFHRRNLRYLHLWPTRKVRGGLTKLHSSPCYWWWRCCCCCRSGGAHPDRHRRSELVGWDGEEVGGWRVDRFSSSGRSLTSGFLSNLFVMLPLRFLWFFKLFPRNFQTIDSLNVLNHEVWISKFHRRSFD